VGDKTERPWTRPVGGRCDGMAENGMPCPLPAKCVTWPDGLRFCDAHGDAWRPMARKRIHPQGGDRE
jgi:hypothetical protein